MLTSWIWFYKAGPREPHALAKTALQICGQAGGNRAASPHLVSVLRNKAAYMYRTYMYRTHMYRTYINRTGRAL